MVGHTATEEQTVAQLANDDVAPWLALLFISEYGEPSSLANAVYNPTIQI